MSLAVDSVDALDADRRIAVLTVFSRYARQVKLVGGDTDDFRQELVIYAYTVDVPDYVVKPRVFLIVAVKCAALRHLKWLCSSKGWGNASPVVVDETAYGNTTDDYSDIFADAPLVQRYPELRRFFNADGQFIDGHASCSFSWLALKKRILELEGIATRELENVNARLEEKRRLNREYRARKISDDPDYYRRNRARFDERRRAKRCAGDDASVTLQKC